MKNNKNVKIGILVAILLLSVVFAVVSTNLSINGVTSLKSNNDEFEQNVVFASTDDKKPTLTINSSKVITNQPTVTNDGKTISFTTPQLDSIDEVVTLSYYVENKSQYSLTLGEMKCNAIYNGDVAPDTPYIEVKPVNRFKDTVLATGITNSVDTVEVRVVRAYVGNGDISYNITCEMTATAIEK